MPPVSSLIFVVILAVWAVYLVQHWVRRRDHLATARSVDRFSEAMRVLERRRALPRPDLSEPAPRSYSVSPLRPARPAVVVKRGVPGATAVAPSPAYRRARTAARLRATALLVGSAVLVALVGLALAGVLHTGWIFVGIAALALSVSLVRWSVGRERARRRTAARAQRRPARAPDGAGAEVPAGEHVLARQSVAATTRTARRSVSAVDLYDVDAEQAQTGAAADAEPAHPARPAPMVPVVLDEETTWDPVPVPPPTYTLKAKAHRGGATAGTGADQLPADGAVMALDEEFEDLPRVDRVG